MEQTYKYELVTTGVIFDSEDAPSAAARLAAHFAMMAAGKVSTLLPPGGSIAIVRAGATPEQEHEHGADPKPI